MKTLFLSFLFFFGLLVVYVLTPLFFEGSVALVLVGIAIGILITLYYKMIHIHAIVYLPWKTSDGNASDTRRSPILTSLEGIGIALCFIVIIGILEQLFFSETYPHNFLFSFIHYPPHFFIQMLGVAIAEEYLFRGGVVHLLISCIPQIKKRNVLFIASIMFSLIHLIGISGMDLSLGDAVIWIFNLSVAGYFLGYLYIRYGLLLVILIHWIWNVVWNQYMVNIERSFFILPVVLVLLWYSELRYRANQRKSSV